MLNDPAQFAAKRLGHSEISLFISIKHSQEILSRDEIDPTALKRFCRCPIRLARKGSVHSQQITWLRYA